LESHSTELTSHMDVAQSTTNFVSRKPRTLDAKRSTFGNLQQNYYLD
jgi:hypothetical protein